MKAPDYRAIQKEIDKNLPLIKCGLYDVWDFISDISEKYFKPVDKLWGKRTTEKNPYLDTLFGMLEINEVDLD